MVNEQLSEIERACLLVSSSHDVQRIWSIGRLVHLLRSDTTATQQKLVPKLIVCEVTAVVHLYRSSINIHMSSISNYPITRFSYYLAN